ncbi:MAG TPA: diguanylate cyclase [Noviherbaspirillum sp.]|jgi:diguanylate cyclase (GGDEF)-like protein/PAS domain S-box-containing protein|uniref:diguanylate cyclase domain-containing protein n=1 Tax=Noviherbaspirillum sp. TaxID=1926288 RepID=UPI002DDD4446|nr:diguanylate cyclase [Noviherbaspirillum sp.]HEV2609833.1 diguanylate cyclase [Noviherbaspirillum sp.]
MALRGGEKRIGEREPAAANIVDMNVKTYDGLPDFADLLLDAVFMVDVHGCILYVNAASERILGYKPEEMIGRMMIDFIAPEDRARTMEEAAKVMAGQHRIGFENRYMRKDGRLASIMWSARWSEADQLRIGVARDVTEREQARSLQAATYAVSEAAHVASDLATLLREVHQIIATLIPVSSFAVALCDGDGGTLGFPYHLDSHGVTPFEEEADVRRICIEVIARRESTLRPEPLALLRTGTGSGSVQPVANAASWLAVPLLSQAKSLGAMVMKSPPATMYTDKDKELLQFVSMQVATAIERKQLHAALLAMTQFDELTGLPNRRLFYSRMEAALAAVRKDEGRMAILYIDLDNFKQINDTLGHAGGDLLLQEVARRLKQCMRDNDTVARLGGDEFVVLVEQLQMPGQALSIAGKIRAALGREMTIDGNVVRSPPSIGVALYPDDGDGIDQLLGQADRAMYEEKKIKAAPAE